MSETASITPLSVSRADKVSRLRHDIRQRNLIDAYDTFLRRFDVTHFFTLTSARSMSHSRLRMKFLDWIDALEWLQRKPLGWFRADELKRWSGLGTPGIPLHFHGLLIGAPHLHVRQAQGLWHEMAGSADIDRYYPHRGAIRYCLKLAFVEPGDYEIGGLKAFRPQNGQYP